MARSRILVIDDERAILETIFDILDAKGYEVHVTESGQRGISLVGKEYYDVVIVDIVMPEMNGVEAYRHIRNISPSSSVIMMTGYSPANPLVRSAIDGGVKRLLYKPFQASTLLDAIESAVECNLCVYQVY